jgi:hypothetical protein
LGYNLRGGRASEISEHDKVIADTLTGENKILGVGARAKVEDALPVARLSAGESK